MKKNLIVSSIKNANGTKVNIIFTGTECLFYISDWGAVCFARIDETESDRQQKIILKVWGDLGSRSFDTYLKKLRKMYKESGIKKPVDFITESAGSGFFSSLDIKFTL